MTDQAPQEDRLCSLESEQLLLAAIIQRGEPTLLRSARKIAQDRDFHLDAHVGLWATLCALEDAGHPLDVASVADKSRSSDTFIGGADYLSSLLMLTAAQSASEDSILNAAKRIVELSYLRQLERTLIRAKGLCANGADFEAVTGFVEDDLINLRRQRETVSTGPQQIQFFATKVIDQIQHVSENGTSSFTFRTGMPSFDRATNGLQRGDLIILAGRPSMGKTAAMLALAEGLQAQSTEEMPISPLIFSCEMAGERLALRKIAAKAGVSVNNLRRAELSDSEWESVPDAVTAVSQESIFIDDTPGILLPVLRARAREHVARYPNSPILIDYLQIVAMPTTGRHQEMNQKVGEISSALKQLARELGVPVVALSQLNRDLEKRANKRPILSDLRESGAIEQDADVIVFLYRDEVYNPDTADRGIAEWIIAKQRDGETGTIRTQFVGTTMTYVDMGVHGGDY